MGAAALLIVVAILVAVGGFSELTQATTGVGLIALACFLGILARIAQAAVQHASAGKAAAPRSVDPIVGGARL